MGVYLVTPRIQLSFLFILISAVVMIGCSGHKPVKVQRIAVDEVHDLSGQWNDTDSKLVSKEMVQDMLSRAWLSKHVERTGALPSVIVGQINNVSHEHINTTTFINDIERDIINSGEVEFVADGQERLQLRTERKDQDVNASEASRKAMGQELGADYMMLGTISTLVDSAAKKQLTFYQVDLKLISLVDNRTVWVGQKKIKKLIEGKMSRY